MSDVADYLAEVELALVSSPTVATYQVIRSWANTDDGYIRVRATLARENSPNHKHLSPFLCVGLPAIIARILF
jgi:hypothetical protein